MLDKEGRGKGRVVIVVASAVVFASYLPEIDHKSIRETPE